MQAPLVVLVFLLAARSLPANQVLLKYLDIGDQGTARLLTADPAGNLFAVCTVVDDAGRNWMRAIKLSPAGIPLASLDFGSPQGDSPAAAATDASGNLIVAGYTSSSDYPLVAPLFPANTKGGAFVTKLDSQLHGILFSTVLSAAANALAVGVDPAGNIYVAGVTTSPSFPLTSGAIQTKPPAHDNFGTASYAYFSEISAKGDRLLYSTYFGGDGRSCNGGSACVGVYGQTSALALAVGPSGSVVIAGDTYATDLPVTAGAFSTTCNCTNHSAAGFVAEFQFAGTPKLAWSTYVNMAQGFPSLWAPAITINAVASDSAGNIVIGGSAGQNLTTTAGVVQPTIPAGALSGALVAKLSASGAGLIWCTYLGEGGISRLAVDSLGRIAVTGSSQLPSSGVPPAGPVYVARLSEDASAVQDLYAGPANSAASGLVLTSGGTFVSLGWAGSLWIETAASGPSLLATANAASGPVSGLVAPYELISLYGIGIGPQTALNGQVQNGVFTSALGGYQVLFDGVAAPLLYLGATQINAVVPGEILYQDYTHLQIVTPTGTVDGPTLAVRLSEPSIFQDAQTGLAAALNQDGSVNSPQNPARPGSIVTIFATGGGTYGWADGTVVPADRFQGTALAVSVHAAPASLEVLYAGDAPGLVAGVMQVNFRLPDSFPPGDTFLVSLQIGAVLSGGRLIAVVP